MGDATWGRIHGGRLGMGKATRRRFYAGGRRKGARSGDFGAPARGGGPTARAAAESASQGKSFMSRFSFAGTFKPSFWAMAAARRSKVQNSSQFSKIAEAMWMAS